MSNNTTIPSSQNADLDQDKMQSQGREQPTSSEVYKAPYYPVEGTEWAIPGQYSILFYSGHTLAKHLAFVGSVFKLREFPKGREFRNDFEKVRRDPRAEWWWRSAR